MKLKYNCYHVLCLLVLTIPTSANYLKPPNGGSLTAGHWTSKPSHLFNGDGCVEGYKRTTTGCTRMLSMMTGSNGPESATPTTLSREKREVIVRHRCPNGHECVLGECVKSTTMNEYDDKVDVYEEASKQVNLPSTSTPKPTLTPWMKPRPTPKTTTTPKPALPPSPPTTAVPSKNISNNHKMHSKASHLKPQLFNIMLVLVSLVLVRL